MNKFRLGWIISQYLLRKNRKVAITGIPALRKSLTIFILCFINGTAVFGSLIEHTNTSVADGLVFEAAWLNLLISKEGRK